MNAYYCLHCWSVTEGENAPLECPHCHVGWCHDCGTRLMDSSAQKYCYGCGRLQPLVTPRMCRASSTGMLYCEMDWVRAGVPEGQDHYYSIATLMVDRDGLKAGDKMLRRNFLAGERKGKSELVRVLTDAEAATLREAA